jgi:dolichol-phosphate hexosyltransferase
MATDILAQRSRGRSKVSTIREGFQFLATIVTIARLYNPLKFFGLIGALFLLPALLLGIDPVAHYARVRRVEDTEIYRLFMIMVLSIVSINIVTFGAFCIKC